MHSKIIFFLLEICSDIFIYMKVLGPNVKTDVPINITFLNVVCLFLISKLDNIYIHIHLDS